MDKQVRTGFKLPVGGGGTPSLRDDNFVSEALGASGAPGTKMNRARGPCVTEAPQLVLGAKISG